MLIKGKDILGLKVITLERGKIIEDVNDLVYDSHTNRVHAFVVDKGGWFSDAKIVLFSDVKSIGRDAIIVQNETAIQRASNTQKDLSSIKSDDTHITRTKIITQEGNELGKVEDILFESDTGEVKQLIVSQGLKDLHSGKKVINVSDIITLGEDATIVRTAAEADVKEQAQHQGLQGAINKAKDLPSNPDTHNAVESAKESGSDFLSTAEQKLDQINEKIRTKINEVQNSPQTQNLKQQVSEKSTKIKEKAENDRIQSVLGKYLTTNLLAPDDTLLAAPGDIITHQLIEEARKYNLLNTIFDNASNDAPVRERRIREEDYGAYTFGTTDNTDKDLIHQEGGEENE
jgi:uncharacterized protein YrrD